MNNNITELAEKIANGQWLLAPTAYTALVKRVDNYMNNGSTIKVKANANSSIDNGFEVDKNESNADGIAVIFINGILIKGASEEDEEELGLCNIDNISELLDLAAIDPSISKICLVFNSPGGEVTGIPELSRKIAFIDKNIKSIICWTETQVASAAYWLYSQGSLIGCTESSQLGSIGVYTLIEDHTKELKASGVEILPIVSGKYKLIGQEFHILSDNERQILQTGVEITHNKFKTAIKTNRPQISDETLEGLSYSGDIAIDLQLADIAVDSFDEFLTNN